MRTLIPECIKKPVRVVRSLLKLHHYCVGDMVRYARFSSTLVDPATDRELLESRILAHAHVVEKGLSLRDTRPGFGEGVVDGLLLLLGTYRERFGCAADTFAFDEAVGALLKYVSFNEARGHDVAAVKSRLSELAGSVAPAGTVAMKKSEMRDAALGDFAEFARSRRSIRDFTDDEVEVATLKEAISLAQTAPSVCNRQSARVHIIAGKSRIAEVLSIQGGSRGFAKRVNKLLVVTSTMRSFHGIQEHLQGFADGGLFAMNLLYGVHYVGLGACPLACYDTTPVGREVHRIAGIPEHERIIMLIAVGHIPETLDVAKSERLPLERVCRAVDE